MNEAPVETGKRSPNPEKSELRCSADIVISRDDRSQTRKTRPESKMLVSCYVYPDTGTRYKVYILVYAVLLRCCNPKTPVIRGEQARK